MIERVEVTPGPGTVIRYGAIAAWASSSASSGLLSFLAVSARNLAGAAAGGRQLADHLVAVLQERDPEPHVPFAVIGPSDDGWVTLLHGPVQIWDGNRWLTPQPSPGWLRSAVWPRPSLAVTFAGASAPAVAPDSLWDLEAGVVPGSGFVMLPAVRSAPVPEAAASAPRLAAVPEPHAVLTEADPPVVEPSPPAVEPSPPVVGAEPPVVEAGPPVAAPAIPAPADTEVLARETDLRPATQPAPHGALDLRSEEVRARVVPYPPLPPGGSPGRPAPGGPVVAGVLCRQGHLNRPGMAACVRCAAAIPAQPDYHVSGTRPALGCLVVDDGAVLRLDRGYLVGSDPGRDPTVRGGLARTLTLEGSQVAPSHAEIRLHDWDVLVTDRDSPGGTFLYGPDSTAWEKLRPYEPRVLAPGTHIAFGQRVVTFLTPWITGSPGTVPPAAGSGPTQVGS